MRYAFFVSTLLTMSMCFHLHGQSLRKNGPVIEKFGGVYEVPDPDFEVSATEELKVVFDVDQSTSEHQNLNPRINTAARFLNMHAQSGFSTENLKVTLVIHGAAYKDILNDDAYKELFGTGNPNAKLIEALDAAGVDIIICGQTAAHRNIDKTDALPQIQWALSAMTVLIHLQNTGYRMIKF
ncbi:DsrE family protein [Ascidiimonas aurantiaca]|uniref:DsrE family protein n=1 Tax=Ascidiimonas aurantiaca TaxID=1685432 RepID=UPI0030ECBE23